MAKRRKKEEEEEPDFEMPDFDREEYMKKEIEKGKTTLVAVGLAPIFSILSFYVFSLTEEWTVGLFAGLLGIAFLKPIYNVLKLEVEDLETKGWAKNFGVYFLTLLAVWVLLMNPPFSDFADPRLNELNVEIRDGGELVDVDNITYGEVYNVTFRAKITSNTEIKEDSIKITVGGGNSTKMRKDPDKEHYYLKTYKMAARDTPYTVEIEMEDVNGNYHKEIMEINIPPQE